MPSLFIECAEKPLCIIGSKNESPVVIGFDEDEIHPLCSEPGHGPEAGIIERAEIAKQPGIAESANGAIHLTGIRQAGSYDGAKRNFHRLQDAVDHEHAVIYGVAGGVIEKHGYVGHE